eukprot:6346233-Pyramimonas_sp.AAC.1
MLEATGRQILRLVWGAASTLDKSAVAMARRILCDGQDPSSQAESEVRYQSVTAAPPRCYESVTAAPPR